MAARPGTSPGTPQDPVRGPGLGHASPARQRPVPPAADVTAAVPVRRRPPRPLPAAGLRRRPVRRPGIRHRPDAAGGAAGAAGAAVRHWPLGHRHRPAGIHALLRGAAPHPDPYGAQGADLYSTPEAYPRRSPRASGGRSRARSRRLAGTGPRGGAAPPVLRRTRGRGRRPPPGPRRARRPRRRGRRHRRRAAPRPPGPRARRPRREVRRYREAQEPQRRGLPLRRRRPRGRPRRRLPRLPVLPGQFGPAPDYSGTGSGQPVQIDGARRARAAPRSARSCSRPVSSRASRRSPPRRTSTPRGGSSSPASTP